MNLSISRKGVLLLASLILVCLMADKVSLSPAQPPLPNPVITFVGQEFYQANGKQWIRYKYMVTNFADYPNEMFAAAPDLPPCGLNKKSSRTWVDIYDSRGKRLYGFCALSNHNDLGKLWFALETDVTPSSYVYIELNDRKTNTKYKSNLAETTP